MNINKAHNPFVPDAKFFHQMLESIEDYAVFATDEKGFIIYWNAGAENVLQYSEDEAVGMDASKLYTDEDQQAGIPQRELTTAFNKGKSINERYHVRKDGSLFWGSGLAFPLYNEHKDLIGFTKIMRDLTVRKNAEQAVFEAKEYFKSIVETVRNPLVILNTDLIVDNANAAFYTHFKIKKEDVDGLSFLQIDEGRWQSDKMLNLLNTLVEGNANSADIEVKFTSPRTNTRTLLINAQRIFGFKQYKEMLLLSIEDVTERKASDQQRNDFIGIVSHELKTPVTSLKAFGQFLQMKLDEAGDAVAVTMLQKMDAQINKLTLLINDLLDATRIEGGKLKFNESRFSFRQMVDEVVEEVQRTSTKHQIVKEHVDDVTVFGDKERLGQVLTNLLTNAIKYSPDSQEVLVRTKADATSVTCSVKDFGIGIPPEKLAHVFERFFRVTNDNQNMFPGIGLGLYISSQIIKRQNGNIWVESEYGKGSTFSFSLPISNA